MVRDGLGRRVAIDEAAVETGPLSEENEKWQLVIAGFERIMSDPQETPQRRRKAREAWKNATRVTARSSVGTMIGEHKPRGS